MGLYIDDVLSPLTCCDIAAHEQRHLTHSVRQSQRLLLLSTKAALRRPRAGRVNDPQCICWELLTRFQPKGLPGHVPDWKWIGCAVSDEKTGSSVVILPHVAAALVMVHRTVASSVVVNSWQHSKLAGRRPRTGWAAALLEKNPDRDVSVVNYMVRDIVPRAAVVDVRALAPMVLVMEIVTAQRAATTF